MEQTVEQNTVETPSDKAKFEAVLTEALHEFELSRERMKKDDLAFEASQASTRATLEDIDRMLRLMEQSRR